MIDFIEHRTNKISIANNKINSNEKFLYHKTTIRPWYDDTSVKIAQDKVYDEIFLNQHNEITEGLRNNIMIQKDGILYTPSIECGLLNGILRDEMLRQRNVLKRNYMCKI